MNLTRREILTVCAAGIAAPAFAGDERRRMGVVIHSYGQRRFNNPLAFLEHCHSVGAGGIQTSLGARDEAYAAKLRDAAAAKQMYVEGSVGLPRDESGVERFAAEVLTAKRAGATVLRTAILGGRRYETFDSADAFRQFAERSWKSLTLAEPVVRKHGLKLAVENHKDWRVEDLLGMLKKLDSAHVGVCVDTGNSIALLEEPHAVVEAYAPRAFTTHIKDMGVEEYADGFLLSEVPLGTGYLDMSKIVGVLRKANPDIRLNLEMITRDPLKVPCLTPKYWATFESLPGRHLADTLRMVRANAAKKPLPRVSGLGTDEKIKAEDENVRVSLKYARDRLGA